MSTDQILDRLAGVLTDPLLAAGLDVEAIELASAGRRRLLRIAVDRDGGVTTDDLAEASRAVSRLLDDSGVMGDRPYTLEVSSPGTDRPLTLPRHWRRNRGRLVRVSATSGDVFTGRISDGGETSASVEVDGVIRPVPYDQVARARVEVEFARKEV